jgi:hypothetical protein
VPLDPFEEVVPQGVLEGAVGAQVGGEEALAVCAKGGGAVAGEVGRGQACGLAACQRHLGKRHLRVLEDAEQGVGAAGDDAGLGQDPLLGGAQHVLALARQVAQEVTMRGEPGLLRQEGGHALGGEHQDLRPHVGRASPVLGEQQLDFLP